MNFLKLGSSEFNINFQFIYKDLLLEYKLKGGTKWKGSINQSIMWIWKCTLKLVGKSQKVESNWSVSQERACADALRRLYHIPLLPP